MFCSVGSMGWRLTTSAVSLLSPYTRRGTLKPRGRRRFRPNSRFRRPSRQCRKEKPMATEVSPKVIEPAGSMTPQANDIAQRALATLESVRSACDRLAANLTQADSLVSGEAFTIGDELGRFGLWCVEVAENLSNSADIPSPWESDLERDAMRKRRGFDDDAKPTRQPTRQPTCPTPCSG